MSVLISVHQLQHSFSHRPLFEGLTFSVQEGEKIALIGNNGAGKSTLMKILAGWMEPDQGKVARSRGLKVGYLPQEPIFEPGITVDRFINSGLEGWDQTGLAQEMISRLKLDPSARVSELSGGWQKKVALARELALQPQVLLLDEPTNHLDVETILWLERWIQGCRYCVMTISHDRRFLERITDRVIEVDRRNPDGILSHDGSLQRFFEMKAQYLEAQAARQESMQNVLRRETEWLRRGAKARTTKQKARIDRAEALAEEVKTSQSINRAQTMSLEFDTASAPKKLIEAKAAKFQYPGANEAILDQVEFTVHHRTRLGLIGNNGTGKSTFLKLLIGDLKPVSGSVVRAERLQVAMFEQQRVDLDPDVSVLRTLCPTGETVEFQGRKMHVRSYLEKFNFYGNQVELAVGKLSGGERARLSLAQLMLEPANLLILDEPTNDLDFQTLALLQEALDQFPGAILLVSHDRSFMASVCDQFLAFPERVMFSDLDQWERWFLEKLAGSSSAPNLRSVEMSEAKSTPKKSNKKLSYKEQFEYDGMEKKIAEAEALLQDLEQRSTDPATLAAPLELRKVMQQISDQQLAIETYYARWAELESKQK